MTQHSEKDKSSRGVSNVGYLNTSKVLRMSKLQDHPNYKYHKNGTDCSANKNRVWQRGLGKQVL